MTEILCACGCGRKKMVRTADTKRGWGKYYSKSCKARAQEARTGQYARHLYREATADDNWNFDDMDGHFSNEDN